MICTIALFISLLILIIPLQKMMPLSRAQHYGLASIVFGIGYILQAVLNWKNHKKWGRRSYLVSGLLFISIGIFFTSSPWLDSSIGIQTGEERLFSQLMFGGYALCAVLIAMVWWRFYQERKQ